MNKLKYINIFSKIQQTRFFCCIFLVLIINILNPKNNEYNKYNIRANKFLRKIYFDLNMTCFNLLFEIVLFMF